MAVAVHIGDAARLAGVSADTIRFYQRLGLVKAGSRSAGGYRIFNGEQIHDLKFVRNAQELGFSLDEIKELLALREKRHVCSAVQSMLNRKLADVRVKIQSLAHLEAELKSALHNCNRELRIQGEVNHDDCCPLLDKLERMNGKNHGATKRQSARK